MRVVAGRHEGETGLIVRIEANLAVLLSDLALHEVSSGGLCRSLVGPFEEKRSILGVGWEGG